MSAKKRVLVVGLGNMGLSHALPYARIDGFDVVGAVANGKQLIENFLTKDLVHALTMAGHRRCHQQGIGC